MDKYLHGSPEVWDELFSNRDLSYTEKAGSQGKLFEMVKVTFLEKLLDSRLRGNDSVKSLEVGCGTAFVSLYFAKRGFEATCLDSSKEVLSQAQKNFKQEKQSGEFITGDANKLPFKDNSFDLVMSFGLLEHFEDPSIPIKEMVRVLKPGGLFFADIVPARFSVQSLGNIFNAIFVFGFYLLKGKVSLGYRKAKANFYPEYYENSISWQDYKKMIGDLGFKKVEVRGNRPFPRLTLPNSVDKYLYTPLLKLLRPIWTWFDNSNSSFSKFFGAGWWFFATK